MNRTLPLSIFALFLAQPAFAGATDPNVISQSATRSVQGSSDVQENWKHDSTVETRIKKRAPQSPDYDNTQPETTAQPKVKTKPSPVKSTPRP